MIAPELFTAQALAAREPQSHGVAGDEGDAGPDLLGAERT